MSESVLELPDGRTLPLDAKGYLLNWQSWSPEVAQIMAQADDLLLEADHWQVLYIFRNYFEEFEIEPPMRALVKICRQRLGAEKGASRYLYRLFPDGPATQACRYAGLPRPVSCI